MKMGGAGSLPAPVGNVPTGMTASATMKQASGLSINAAPVPSGNLPDGTDW
ncbi:MAG: hypothetical protein HY735_34815 [Verrucomicrobia bacterium]|nr:hypothetical protein [Verrucomicrobiota bacterium]